MQEILPQLPPRPAPTQNSAAPRPYERPADPPRVERDRGDSRDSFSDTYEAVEAEDAPERPEASGEDAEQTASALPMCRQRSLRFLSLRMVRPKWTY